MADGKQLVLLSGVVSVEMKSPGWVNEAMVTGWFKDKLHLDLALPAGLLRQGQSFRIDDAVPYLSLNAIGGASNVGWGVNSFAIAKDDAATQSVRLTAELVVSRSGEIIHRVAYHVTLIGEVLG